VKYIRIFAASFCLFPKEIHMKLSMKQTVLALALVGALGTANATALVANVPTTSVDITTSFFGGTLLSSAISNVSTPSYSGIARTAVYDTGSGLDFYYQFSNNSASKTGIERLTGYDFSTLGSSVISVYQTSSAFGIFTTGTETADGSDRTIAGVIGFSFIPNAHSKILPGSTSFTQVIRTNARDYVAGNFGILDGFASNAAAFAPAPALPVPEPESFAMLLAGLGLMGTIARRRTRARS
jgi:hypothetical protein